MSEQLKRKLVLGSLAVSVLLSSVGTSMANIALPAIASEFGTSFKSVRWVVLGYLIATTLFSLLVGRLGDLKGRRGILLAGTSLFATGTLVSGFASAFWILVTARVAQGIGASALVVLPMAIVTEAVPPEKTGRAIGLLATVSAIGTAFGPSLGGFVLGLYGWRSAFFLMTILALASLFLLLKFVAGKGPAELGAQDSSNFAAALKAVYLDSSLTVQLLFNLTVSAVMMTTLIVGPFYLTKGLHLTAFQMGLAMSAGPVTSIVSGIFSGYAVDRFGSGAIIKFGFVQLLFGALSFVCLPSIFGSFGFAFSAVLLSLGYQLFLSANSSSVMKSVVRNRRGLVSGALSLSRNLGLITGTYAMGNIFDFVAKGSSRLGATPASIATGLQVTFLFAAVLILILLLKNLKTQQRRTNETRFLNQAY